MYDVLDRLTPQAVFTIMAVGQSRIDLRTADFLQLMERLNPGTGWRKQLSYHWLASDLATTALTEYGRSLVEPHLNWITLMLERETERIIEILRVTPSSLRPHQLYRDYVTEPLQAEMMAAALVWLILSDVVVLDWTDRLILCQGDNEPIRLLPTEYALSALA